MSRRPTNLAGWTFELVGLGIVVLNAMLTLAYVGVAVPGSVPAAGLWAIVDEYAIFSIALLPMLWLLFPDGKPPTPRWRVLVRVYFGALAVVAAVAIVMPGPLNNLGRLRDHLPEPDRPVVDRRRGRRRDGGRDDRRPRRSPSRVCSRPGDASGGAEGEERQQLRWLRFVISIAVVLFLSGFLGSLGFGLTFGEDTTSADVWSGVLLALLALTLALGLPAAYLVAIYRYGLWDLDLVIRKTLIVAVVGVTLTAIGLGLLLLVPVLTLGIGGALDAAAVIPVVVGLALGLLFGPIRRRARRFADRVVYGRRATPYEVLTSLGERLSGTYAADDVLPRMALVLAQATGADAAHVWLRIGGPAAARGRSGPPTPSGRRPSGRRTSCHPSRCRPPSRYGTRASCSVRSRSRCRPTTRSTLHDRS